MKKHSMLSKLYTGEGGIDFVGKRRIWYGITAVILVACVLGIALRGFSWSIDFVGGTKMNLPAANLETSQVEETFVDATGVEPDQVQIVGSGDARILEINSERLSDEQINSARTALFDAYQPKGTNGTPTPDAIGDSTVSESWGSTITKRMILSMLVFMGAVFIYIAVRLQREMAVAAIAALLVDLVAITGIYAIVGFEVSPATIIGLLTVLAFSLYDTVIVFDKVRENTAGYRKDNTTTYAERANMAINETVMRSISTTVISALPIISLMVVAVWMMGVGTLKDLALVQLIGVIEGTFSSVFLATPFLVDLQSRRRETKKHDAAVQAARAAQENGDDESTESIIVEELETVSPRGVTEAVIVEEKPFGTTQQGPGNTGASWRPDRG